MTKATGLLVILGIMNITLVIMHFTDYVLLFLKPTGYVIPLVFNIAMIIVLVFKSKLSNVWIMAILFIGLPIVLVHGFFILLMDND
ncbi:hypothetical protein ACQKDB_12280 [Planococcus kocurii]|uniref:hypothetical protein n=1 Tax=Planococcus kocurii TaxID=1374 RepID=UPI003D023B23